MPPGTRVGEFELQQVLGTGGFGIVYLALDHSLMRKVAIKEYAPHALVTRDDGLMLRLRATTDTASFDVGLRSFLNEARLLASLDHPSLVKVHRFWKENGTAYMAMPYYDGRTLKELRAEMGRAPDEVWLQKLIHSLLGALEVLHAQRIYHRDISPDNILILPDGRPILLDFGSARRVAGDAALGLTAIIKPNFAPVEQYADTAGMPQGPWTDLYALGAVVYFMLKGEAPLPSVVRAMHGATPLLSAPDMAAAYQAVTPSFLRVIDWALAVNPQDRPQSVMALRRALNGELSVPLPQATSPGRFPSTQPQPVTSDTHADALQGAGAPPARGARVLVERKAVFGKVIAIAALALAPAVLLMGHFGKPASVASEEEIVRTPAATSGGPSPIQAVTARATVPTSTPRATVSVRQPKERPQEVAPRPISVAKASTLDSCATKNFVMKAVCVRRACGEPLLQQHEQCRQLRAEDEARLQLELGR
ncbi:serine/threonine-protein kinase [Piscinibacter sp. XHJ-5]|uniref:serine/threonine protein kinase n=1 Tax=Piscinibacter sp. XHJ-5 TaxID=3037797 RepID=UPI002452E2B8|nr:serine/threonine-protein kinase [Piscinibacter sp. XHJ-5]